MKIGVISDTHDKLATIDAAFELFTAERVDVVVHCGDWKSLAVVHYFAEKATALKLPVKGVLGNNDTDSDAFLAYAAIAPGDFELSEGLLEIPDGEQTIAVYHGHHAPTLRRIRTDPRFRIVLLGHTHKPKIEEETDRLMVNPGSTAFAIPRRKDWLPTVAIVDTRTCTAELRVLALDVK